jgi:hypothetical protein
MTETDAADHGGRVAYLPLDAVDRAITAGETRGFVKLVAGPRRVLRHTGGGRILGATVVAPTGGELVHEAALAMRTRMFTGRLAQTTHAYPTWSTAVQQAAAQFFIEIDGRTPPPDSATTARDRPRGCDDRKVAHVISPSTQRRRRTRARSVGRRAASRCSDRLMRRSVSASPLQPQHSSRCAATVAAAWGGVSSPSR